MMTSDKQLEDQVESISLPIFPEEEVPGNSLEGQSKRRPRNSSSDNTDLCKSITYNKGWND